MITALAFVATLALLVVIHEYGHYRAALACGVKVMRFSVGFGRVLWRRQASPQATEFVVCMLPLGGYVRMLDDREGPIDPAQSHQAFNRKPLWQRAFVVFAGPAANLLLAVFLYSAVQWMGVLEPQAVLSAPPAQSVAARAGLKSGDWVRAWSADGLSWQEVRSMVDLRWRALDARVNGKPLYLMVSDSQGRGSRAVRLDAPAGSRSADPEAMRELGLGAPWSPAVLGEIKPGGPADQAGLRAGDKVVTVDGLPIQDAQALREAIQARPGQTSTWIVLRTEGTVQVEVRPRTQRAGQGTVGKIDAFVGLAAPTVMVSMGPLDGLIEGVNKTWDVSVLTVSTIGRMIVGQASIKNLSGPLTIADYAGQSAQKGWSSYLAFLALVSVSLGILNLLPLPMLDGGHLMYYLFEGLTGRPVSDAWLERLQRGGIAILLTLMSVALFNDVARLVGFH
ncbi:MAG: RIP metalloprotease RseP [Rubrivivax sp.]